MRNVNPTGNLNNNNANNSNGVAPDCEYGSLKVSWKQRKSMHSHKELSTRPARANIRRAMMLISKEVMDIYKRPE